MLTVEVRRVPNRTCAQVIRPNRLFVFVEQHTCVRSEPLNMFHGSMFHGGMSHESMFSWVQASEGLTSEVERTRSIPYISSQSYQYQPPNTTRGKGEIGCVKY